MAFTQYRSGIDARDSLLLSANQRAMKGEMQVTSSGVLRETRSASQDGVVGASGEGQGYWRWDGWSPGA